MYPARGAMNEVKSHWHCQETGADDRKNNAKRNRKRIRIHNY